MRKSARGKNRGPGRLLLLGVVIAIGAGGCLGQGDDPGDESNVGTGARASEIEDECTVSDVTWANSHDEGTACAGPWIYRQHATETSPHPTCGGPIGCVQHASCSRWVPQPPVSASTSYTLPHGGCGFVPGEGLVCRPNWAAATQRCNEFKTQKTNEVEAPADQVVTGASSSVSLTSPSNASSHTYSCTVTVNYNRQFIGPHPDCGCAVPLHPTCEHAVVTPAPQVRVVTPPGRTRAQVRAAHNDAPPGQLSDAEIQPTCSTGEDEPALLAKLDRLLAGIADAEMVPPGSALLGEFVRRAKLTYELLDNDDVATAGAPHDDILTLYERFPSIEPTCGRHKPATQQACAGDWQLRLCTRLTSAHVRVEPGRGDLVRQLYPGCIDQLAALGDDIERSACSAEGDFADAAADAHRRLHDKVLLRLGALLDPSPAGNNAGRIADALHLIDRWYAQAERVVADPDELRAQLDLVANKFWQVGYGYRPGSEASDWIADSPYAELEEKLEAAENAPPATARQIIESALGDAEARGLKLDREVLAAAYGDIDGEPVLVGTPLLRITSDALGPLVERLEALVQFHDVGCALARCVQFSTPTKLSRFWKVLAHLTAGPGSVPDLGDVLAATPGNLLGWKPAFAAIEAAQQRLLDASAAALDEGGEDEIRLLAFIDQARARTVSYEATGMFLPPVGGRLYTGMHANQRARVKDHLNGLNQILAATHARIDDRLMSLVQGLVRVRDGETALEQLEATRERLALELDDLRGRDAAFRAVVTRGGAESERSVFEQLMAEWSTLEGASDEEAYLRVGDSTNLFLTGQDAAFDGWRDADVADVAVQKIAVAAGQTISITTAGAWAPSCALRRAHVAPADGGPGGPGGQRIDPTGVVAGPEGYSITWTGADYEAQSEHGSRTRRLTAGGRFETCAKTPGLDLGGGAKACLYVDLSFTDEEGSSWQNGMEDRTSAQFSSGIFLPITPFEAAAGSLVVVEMPPGEIDPDRIRDVHSVRGPHTTIVVDESADLWFAVNDIHCANQDGNNQLHVKVATFMSFGDAAKALLGRMAHTIAIIREHLPGLLRRGEILPSEATEIQLQAKLDTIGGPGAPPIAVDDYPAPMRDLFYKYLAREMTRLEAAIRLKNIEREIVIKEAEYAAATLAVQNTTMSGYLVSLLPKWTVRGLHFKELRGISSAYVRDVHEYLAPLLRVWYPEVLANLGTVSALQGLTTVDVDTPVMVATGWLTDLGDELALRIQNAEVPYPSPQDTAPTFVALRFPHPTALDPACAGSPSARCPRLGHPGTFRWATSAQSRALWQSLGQPNDGGTVRQLVFQPTPDDLYSLLGGTHYLSCSRSLPVVRKIGLALTGYSASQLPPELRETEGHIPAAAPMAFSDGAGIHEFELVNPSWLHLANVPLVYGTADYNQVRTDFTALVQDVRGVSPFSTFVFDIPEQTVAQWNLRGAKTLDLILEIEAIRSNDIVAVPACTVE